jgi:integrase
LAKRRGNKDGSIRERRKGLWEARVDLDGHRLSAYGKTRADAAGKLRKLIETHERGGAIPGGRQTTAAYLTDWLAFVRDRVRPRTWERYEQLVRVHLVPAVGSLLLTKLGADRLERLYSEKLAAGLSKRTVHHLHVVLGTALRRALRQGKVAANVCAVAVPPRLEQKERPTLSAAKVRELLTAAESDRFYALYFLATHTGMREGELLGLRWAFVDFGEHTVRVAATLQRTKTGFILAEPKTERSKRTISVGPEVMAALRIHKRQQAEERMKVADVWDGSLGLVFPNELGRPMEAGNFLRRSFWPLLAKVGLAETIITKEERIRRGKKVVVEVKTLRPLVRFHDLRHSFASLALERNVHPSVVAATLGHARTSTTVDMYSHVQPGMTGEATSVVEDLIAGRPMRARKPAR